MLGQQILWIIGWADEALSFWQVYCELSSAKYRVIHSNWLISCVFPVLAQAFTQNWWGLLLCRLFMGLGMIKSSYEMWHWLNHYQGMGVKVSTIPVFSAEISPASIRGGLVTSFQLWVAFGIFMYTTLSFLRPHQSWANLNDRGFCSNLIFYRIGTLAWRFQLAAAFAPAVPVLIFVWFCPGKIPILYSYGQD